MKRIKMPEYQCWQNMKQRCCNENNPRYRDYGGRGITVCARWLDSFDDFYADMGQRPSRLHSIERKDNDKGYELGNCIWALKPQQYANRRQPVRVRPWSPRIRMPSSEAGRVLTAFGGVMKLAQIIGEDPATVSRWTSRSPRGGQGRVPIKFRVKVLAAALRLGIDLAGIFADAPLSCPTCGTTVTEDQLRKQAHA